MSDLISREAAIEAVGDVHPLDYNGQAILHRIKALPTIDHAYGFPLEHLAYIARVIEKEGVTPEEVAELLQYAGEISEMAADVMQTIREAVRRIDDDPSHPFADGVMMKE